MITEDYVNFETAKLLKEKGFDEICYLGYNKNGEYVPTSNRTNSKIIQPDFCFICCPTLQMVIKWLREVHNLVIQIEFIDFLEHGEVWLYSIIERKTIKQLTDRDEDFTEHSYEEAEEAAIKYCLENLI